MVFPDAVLRTSSSAPSSNSLLSIRLALVVTQCSPVVAAWVLPISSLCSPSNPKPSRVLSLRSVRSQKDGRAGVLPPRNARKHSSIVSVPGADGGKEEEEDEQEEEVELSWVEEKVEDLVQYSNTAVRALPGPRVSGGELPWLLALPIGYVAISLVFAVVKIVQRHIAPQGKRRRQVGKNAWLVATLGEYLPAKRDLLDSKKLKQLAKKCQFDLEEVLRKYIRYALNERPFNPELVTGLIHLRKVSMLDDESVAEILNEVSRRIVKAKGPVIVDTTGFTEKGLKRKVAVQALFSKILYLSELDEFSATADRSSLSIKEIFGVTEADFHSPNWRLTPFTREITTVNASDGDPTLPVKRGPCLPQSISVMTPSLRAHNRGEWKSTLHTQSSTPVGVLLKDCEDANLIRIETLSGETEVESLEQLVRLRLDEDMDEEN